MNDQSNDNNDTNESEPLPDVPLDVLIDKIKEAAVDLGFNAKWESERQTKLLFYKGIHTAMFLIILGVIGIALVWLVGNNNIDSSTFSTLLAVLLGAALDRSLRDSR